MLIFIAKDDRQDYFLPDTATAQFFPASTITSIRQAMESLFKAQDYDGGITSAVTGVLGIFRAHLNTAPQNRGANNYPVQAAPQRVAQRTSGGIPVIIWILLIVVGFLIVRSIFRSMNGPRYYGGGPGVPPGPGGPGYGRDGGYGGPGYYGGGGGFWSGLLGGLGGAWLGNEMFGNRGTTIIDQQAAMSSRPIKADRGAAVTPAVGPTTPGKPTQAPAAAVIGAAADSAAAEISAAADSAAGIVAAEVDGSSRPTASLAFSLFKLAAQWAVLLAYRAPLSQ